MVLLIALIALAGAGFFFSHVSGTYGRADIASLISGQAGGSALAQRTDLTTTAIRPASEADQVSAAGNIELSGQRPVVLRADGIVSQVAVEVGDVVAAGDLLVSLPGHGRPGVGGEAGRAEPGQCPGAVKRTLERPAPATPSDGRPRSAWNKPSLT
jgi:hypothetical protein